MSVGVADGGGAGDGDGAGMGVSVAVGAAVTVGAGVRVGAAATRRGGIRCSERPLSAIAAATAPMATATIKTASICPRQPILERRGDSDARRSPY